MRSEPVLNLGKKIIDELGLDQSVDTLSRWMAHYIAQLILSVETAGAEDRSEKLSRCASAILDLWRHRSELPNGKRPFEDVEPILRALESLDLNNNTPRYFRSVRTAAGTAEQDVETMRWLDIADGLDYSARILIRYCLVRAAEDALDRSKEWVALAEAVGTEDGIDLAVLRTISYESELLNSATPDETMRKEIEGRLERLNGLTKMANALSSDLHAQLEQLGRTDGTS